MRYICAAPPKRFFPSGQREGHDAFATPLALPAGHRGGGAFSRRNYHTKGMKKGNEI